jgi:type VI secretion system secreted protein Hcp
MSARAKHVVAAAMVAAGLATTVPAGADDVFIKIGDIKGDSADAKHKSEIDVLSWSWGVSNAGASQVSGGGGSSRANFQNLTITKKVDSSSPKLLLSAAQGQHVANAMLVVRAAGIKSSAEYLKIKLADVIVSSVKVTDTAKSPDGPLE